MNENESNDENMKENTNTNEIENDVDVELEEDLEDDMNEKPSFLDSPASDNSEKSELEFNVQENDEVAILTLSRRVFIFVTFCFHILFRMKPLDLKQLCSKAKINSSLILAQKRKTLKKLL